MTKEITKAFILQQIQEKFKLRDFEPDKFLFSETVVPTYDIAEHLVTREILFIDRTITATGAQTVFPVPQNERYTLFGYSVVFFSGVYTVAGGYIERGDDTKFVYLDLAAGQNVSYTVDLPKPVIFDAEHRFRINVDGYTSTGHLYIYSDVVREEIR